MELQQRTGDERAGRRGRTAGWRGCQGDQTDGGMEWLITCPRRSPNEHLIQSIWNPPDLENSDEDVSVSGDDADTDDDRDDHNTETKWK